MTEDVINSTPLEKASWAICEIIQDRYGQTCDKCPKRNENGDEYWCRRDVEKAALAVFSQYDKELGELRVKYADLKKHWVDFDLPDGGLSIDTDSASDFLREVAENYEPSSMSNRLRDIAIMLDQVSPTIKSLSARAKTRVGIE